MAHWGRKRSIFDRRGIITAIIGTVVGGLIKVVPFVKTPIYV